MTSPPSVKSLPDRLHRGFTLTELLVAIGIIVVLAAVLVPMALRASRQAAITRLAADLQTVAAGLDAYRGDFGDYPRLPRIADRAASPSRDQSSILLAWALIGPYGQSGNPSDGADNPGFRIRQGGQGRVFGPYLQTDRFRTGPVVLAGVTYQQLLDGYGSPIFYLPARADGKADINTRQASAVNLRANWPDTKMVPVTQRLGYVSASDAALYNSADVGVFSQTLVVPPNSGFTDANIPVLIQWRLEQAGNFTGPFILWSAGPNQFFFDNDDATNLPK
jgi:prepilin-type N-terminal cleavage/methylation domain-containing protein